jgi:hypothetical protein
MNTRIAIVVLVLLVAFPGAGGYGFDKSGRTAFQFLKIGVGARQTAVGEAGSSFVRDVNAVFWNPAAIGTLGHVEASVSYNRWFAGMSSFAGAAGINLNGVAVIAASYSVLGYGEIQEALVTGAGGSSDTRTGSMFTGSDMVAGLTVTRNFTDNLSIGVTGKFVQEKLWNYSTSMFAFDVGTFYDTKFKGVRFAMSAQNFGGSVKFLDASDREAGYDIPLLFRIGASIDLVGHEDNFFDGGTQHTFRVAAEALNSNDFGERWHVGAEYVFNDFLSVRGGYRFNYEEGNLSVGIGVTQHVADAALTLDYSYVSYEYLDSPHRITLNFAF